MPNQHTLRSSGLYPLSDWVTDREKAKLGVAPRQRECDSEMIRAMPSGDYRAPKRGEWFLSGAIVSAYKADNDLTTPYHIARLVVAEKRIVLKRIPV